MLSFPFPLLKMLWHVENQLQFLRWAFRLNARIEGELVFVLMGLLLSGVFIFAVVGGV